MSRIGESSSVANRSPRLTAGCDFPIGALNSRHERPTWPLYVANLRPPRRDVAGPAAPFHPHAVATGIRGGYQVVATDMNKDGKVDLIALGSQMTDLMWYENP